MYDSATADVQREISEPTDHASSPREEPRVSERRGRERESADRPERNRSMEGQGGLLRVSAGRVIGRVRADPESDEDPDS